MIFYLKIVTLDSKMMIFDRDPHENHIFSNAKSFIIGLFGSFAFAAVITLQGGCSK